MSWIFEGVSEVYWIGGFIMIAMMCQFAKLNKKIDKLQKQISE
jgi:hypothetical protein